METIDRQKGAFKLNSLYLNADQGDRRTVRRSSTIEELKRMRNQDGMPYGWNNRTTLLYWNIL